MFGVMYVCVKVLLDVVLSTRFVCRIFTPACLYRLYEFYFYGYVLVGRYVFVLSEVKYSFSSFCGTD